MMSKLQATLVTALMLAPLSAAFADETGYFTTAGAPLMSPSHYETGAAQATGPRQRASGYFAAAGAALVEPSVRSQDAGATIEKQWEAGYFPEAGAPLVSATNH